MTSRRASAGVWSNTFTLEDADTRAEGARVHGPPTGSVVKGTLPDAVNYRRGSSERQESHYSDQGGNHVDALDGALATGSPRSAERAHHSGGNLDHIREAHARASGRQLPRPGHLPST